MDETRGDGAAGAGAFPPVRVDRPGRPIETVRTQFRCGACGTPFEADMPSRCPVWVFTGALSALTCPACDGGPVLMGQDRTLAEDRARDRGEGVAGRAAAWAADGEVGSSAVTLYRLMAGHPDPEPAAPRDASDLGRCMLLLDRMPEWAARIGEAAALPGWAGLAAAWPALEAAWRAEGGGDGPAPRTAELLREAIDARDR